jgi:hypothetical protein
MNDISTKKAVIYDYINKKRNDFFESAYESNKQFIQEAKVKHDDTL